MIEASRQVSGVNGVVEVCHRQCGLIVFNVLSTLISGRLLDDRVVVLSVVYQTCLIFDGLYR